MAEIQTVIVGTKFRGEKAIETIAQMRPGDAVRLQREPENKFDLNAVACHFLGRHLGYIPKQANPWIAAAIDAGVEVVCTVEQGPVVRGNRVDAEPKLRVEWPDR